MHHNFKTKYYFIDNFDTKNIDKVDKQTVVIFRNYELKKKDEVLLLKIKKICKKKKLKFYLSNNIKLALKLNLDGAYIPSFNKNFNHLNYSLKTKFEIVGSSHNIKEIRIKETQKVKKIFISSLFKRNKNYLGINKFKLLCSLTKKQTIALGGISKKNIKKLRLLNSPEFAGISYFKE
jgi:thiamine-phosphate pyrophosphorylase